MRILLGGSPCTFWSIAQKNNRETEASGIGWELFKNYLIAKEKFKPDYFLYENNKSADQAIKDSIKRELNVWDGTFLMPYSDVRYIEINSALVSAQNRERFYVHNCGEVELPTDRGILLRDVLESGLTDKEKSYCLKHQAGNTRDYFKKHHTQVAFEPICTNSKIDGKQPSLQDRVYDINGKSTAVTTAFHPSIAEPVRVETMPKPNGELINSQGYRIYDTNGKATAQTSNSGGFGGTTGLYSEPLGQCNYATEFDSDGNPIKAYCYADGKEHAVYEVKDGRITIKGKEYSIKLPDGFYIIRKLTVAECRRLQTVPYWYKFESKETYFQQCYSTKLNKEIKEQCKSVKSKDVISPSQAKKLDCAISTILGSLDTELLNLLGNLSIKAQSVSSRGAKINSKQLWVTASNIIKNGSEINQSTQTKNVSFAVNLLETQGAMECVLNITVNGDSTETHYIGKNDYVNHTEIPATNIIRHQTEDGFIKWLQKKYSEENSLTAKSYTISILTNWIIAKAIFMCAKATKNTWLYIDSWSELQQNSLNLELSNLRMESTEKISDTNAYRMLGNGWTIEVIKHILSHIPGIASGEPIEVLSMYDGMSCARIALKELGANVVKYYATEIDKYAIQTTQANFPDTIQLGDAFQVRDEDWKIGD